MKTFFETVFGVSVVSSNFIDRLQYFYTVCLLTCLAISSSLLQDHGNSIQCLLPDHFTKQWSEYIHRYCLIEPPIREFRGFQIMFGWTPFFKQDLPVETPRYHWIPLFLAFQAFCFILPQLFWRFLLWTAGIDIDEIVYYTTARSKEVPEVLINQLGGAQQRRPGFMVSWLYVLVKTIFCLNAMAQFWILDYFAISSYGHFWGFSVLADLITCLDCVGMHRFPKSILCEVPLPGSIGAETELRKWSFRCILRLSAWSEKLFLLLWFWHFVIVLLSAMNLLHSLFITYGAGSGNAFVRRHLDAKAVNFSDDELDEFVSTRLGHDGVFLLRLIEENGGMAAASEIVGKLRKKQQMPKAIAPIIGDK